MRVSRFRYFAALASAAVIVLVFAGTALGTAPSGIVSGPVLARGDFASDVDVKVKFERDGRTVVSNAPGAGEVVDAVRNLEALDDSARLMAMMAEGVRRV